MQLTKEKCILLICLTNAYAYRLHAVVTICKISGDVWRISSAQEEHGLEPMTGEEYSQLERQQFGDVVKSIADQVISMIFNGLFDKHAEMRAIHLQGLRFLLVDLDFPMSHEDRQKVKKRVRHMAKRDRSIRVRSVADSFINCILRRISTTLERQTVQEILRMRRIERRFDYIQDEATIAMAQAYIDKVLDEF